MLSISKPYNVDDRIIDECVAVAGMKIGRGNKMYLPLCPPQASHDLTWDGTPSRRGGKPATNRLSYGMSLTAAITEITDVTPCSVVYSYTLRMEAARYSVIIDQTTRCHSRKQ
jgi:hypothetical protein